MYHKEKYFEATGLGLYLEGGQEQFIICLWENDSSESDLKFDLQILK